MPLVLRWLRILLWVLVGVVTTTFVSWFPFVFGNPFERMPEAKYTEGIASDRPVAMGWIVSLRIRDRGTTSVYVSNCFYPSADSLPRSRAPENLIELLPAWAGDRVLPWRGEKPLPWSDHAARDWRMVVGSGWPLKSWYYWEQPGPSGPSAGEVMYGIVLHEAGRRRGQREYPVALPCYPIPLGLLLNTLFWGLTLRGIWWGVMAGRGLLRVRRGQCAACGYPSAATAAQCSECGAIRRRSIGVCP